MNFKNNKSGITLVALIVTIIVLLILAGISISALTQTGLFEKAKQAKDKSKSAIETENIILGDYENKIENINANTRENSKSLQLDYSKAVDISSYTSEDNKYTIPENGFLVIEYCETNTTVTYSVNVHISDYPFVPYLLDNSWGIREHFSTIINMGQTVYFEYLYNNSNNILLAYFIPFK